MGPLKKNSQSLNDVGNLMLMCHDCHKKIDQDKEGENILLQCSYNGKLSMNSKCV